MPTEPDLDKIKKTRPKLSPEVILTAKKQAQKVLSDFSDQIRTIKLPELSFPEVNGEVFVVGHDYNKDREEAEIRRLMLEQLKSQKPEFDSPDFDAGRSILKFAGKEVVIDKAKANRQHLLCKSIFKNMASMRKVWSWDELVEDWGDSKKIYGKNGWRKVYGPANEINDKVAIETGIKDLLEVTTKTVCVNLLYLRKPAKS